MKIGGDAIKYTMAQGWCNVCDGRFTSTQRPPANLESLLPVWSDASTWNWNAMSPLFRDYQVAIGNMSYDVHRQIYAAWYQDDWKISNKLTANMGVRYDLDHGAQGECVTFLPWLSGKRPTDKNNLAPRLGFAYAANDKTVIRGGWGLFFTELEDDAHAPVVHPHAAGDRHGPEQRARRLRLQSVGRGEADLRAAARQGVRRGEPAQQLAELLSALDPERLRGSVRRARHVVQPHGVDWHAASARHRRGHRIERDLHRRPQGRAAPERQQP